MNLHNNSKLCPLDTPYLTTKGCSNCTKQSFNYTSSLCVPFQCKDVAYPMYDPLLDRCT
jgi:hypothetical protein